MRNLFLALLALAASASSAAPLPDDRIEQRCEGNGAPQAQPGDPNCGTPVGRSYGRHRATAGRGRSGIERVFPPRHRRHHRHVAAHRHGRHRGRA
jgi:hypothetical protein